MEISCRNMNSGRVGEREREIIGASKKEAKAREWKSLTKIKSQYDVIQFKSWEAHEWFVKRINNYKV